MIEQKEILKKSKKFIKNGHFKNRNVSYNPNYCLCSWAESIGYLNIKEFSEKKISLINRYKIIFKEFFSIHRDNLECKNSKNTTKYQNLVMSYFFPENLRKNGSYYDKYFSLNTDSDKKSIWVLIPLKKSNLRYKTKKNIIILQRKNINFYKNIFFSIYIFIKNFFLNPFFLEIKKIKFDNTNFSKDLSNIISNLLSKKKVKNFIFPYESQSHQHYLVEKLKRKNNKIKIIGYMHTVIPPLPLDYIKRTGHPHLIYVNGLSQKKILCEKLGWKNREVKNLPSLRYKKKINYNFHKNIFLPYFLEDEEKTFKFFKQLVFSKGKGFFPILKVKNHPGMKNSKIHIKLTRKINDFLRENKNFFKNKKKNNKICIFFGSTASIAEGLERGSRVFHICSDPVLEKFDKYYWQTIKSFNINSNTFEYKLKVKGSIIKLNNLERKNLLH